ncbi:hypothetical protein QFC24_004907 [Naganishia onofrii]|uniref:Uncharacterized protein n=1 Tax=Naganishia onofrii TaxID=1851511 RepID=A0ACC2XET3_9TREE|nr:hypothetical protein QFC24_004907 [Naganishia onofrii]
MPVPATKSAMLPVDEVLRTAVREHPEMESGSGDARRVMEEACEVLARGPVKTPVYDPQTTPQLSVCRFRCMLQDTGYPLEVYLPPAADADDDQDVEATETDWSRLKERWVGWAVEVPGEQPWIKQMLDTTPTHQGIAAQMEDLDLARRDVPPSTSSSTPTPLPSAVHGKWPLPEAKGSYTGALIKIYDPNIAFRPGTAYEFIGILSRSHMPASSDDFLPPSIAQDSDVVKEDVLVPAIHVLTEPYEVYPLKQSTLASVDVNADAGAPAGREEVIDYLARLLPRGESSQLDRTAAEVLLLALISRVTSKAPGSVPLGTLTLDLLLPRGSTSDEGAAFRRLVAGIQRVMPLVVDVELSLQLLSRHPFYPISSHVAASASTGDSLQAGLLQLAPGTVVLINEDTLEGGDLQDRGVRNVKALADTVRTQKLRYEFPYVSEEFGMETDLAFVVMGQGKSLLPVDLHMPLLKPDDTPQPEPSATPTNYLGVAAYLVQSRAASARLEIPATVAEFIQAEFIRLRKEGHGVDAKGEKILVGEADLRNWMRMGRGDVQSGNMDAGSEAGFGEENKDGG